MKKLSFKIERDEKEFHVWCPELPGCHSHGKTPKKAMENLKDAIQLYLDVLLEEELTIQSLRFLNEAA